MNDSGGNGWDGATFSVQACDGEQLITPITLVDGSTGTSEICFHTFKGYIISLTDGAKPDQITWTIRQDSVALYSGTTQTVISESCCLRTQWKVCSKHLMFLFVQN
jgi:hypothetical protein